MEELFANIAAGLKAADSFLWGPPLLILLLGTHLFYTVRLRFIQSHLGTAFKLVAKQEGQLSGNVAPFAALAVALASTIGTGNVVGVATAIALGGPGAVFWCMVTGIFGMATKYAESLLAVKYRVKDESGTVHGGPMYTILNGLHWRWMAVLFCVVASIAVLGGAFARTRPRGDDPRDRRKEVRGDGFVSSRQGGASRIRARRALRCVRPEPDGRWRSAACEARLRRERLH